VKEAADKNIEMEIESLELAISNGSREMDVYIRLSQLYRQKKQYEKSVNVLDLGAKLLKRKIQKDGRSY
jgi:hypothetical protein